MRGLVVVCIASCCVFVGCKHTTTPNASTGTAGRTIERVFQAHLPESATNLRAESDEAMIRVIYGTFECSESDLSNFLKESKLLPDQLTTGNNSLAGIKSHFPWWHPELLTDVSGVECNWECGQDIADCRMASSQTPQGRATVYFMVVYENRNATSLRSDVKADQNWHD